MLSMNEINELIKTIDLTSVEKFEFESDGLRLVISKRSKTEPSTASQADYRPAMMEVTSVPLEQTSLIDKEQSVAVVGSVLSEVPSKADVPNELFPIVSPMVGEFYCAPSPGAPAFVKVGDQVNEHTIICIVEAMKLMNEIEAERKGEIVQILVENGQLVEYGQPLFLVKTK